MPRRRVRQERETIAELFGDVVQDRASFLYTLEGDADDKLRLAREPAPRTDPANANAPGPASGTEQDARKDAAAEAAPPTARRPARSVFGRPIDPERARGGAAAPGDDAVPAGFASGPDATAARNADRLRRAQFARAGAERQAADGATRDALPAFADDRGLWSVVTVIHGALSVLTLGLYRPWMKTEARRVIWSHVIVDDEPLDYLGSGAELFRGLMAALIVLGAVLALAWAASAGLGLMTLGWLEARLGEAAGGSLGEGERAALSLAASMAAPALLAGLLVAPLLPVAGWRARRYRLARTRWRGIRFGMEGAGWGMIPAGMVWTPLVLGSAGLLWPVWRWWRERRMTRAMRWGQEPFRFEGGPLPWILHWLPAWTLGATAAVTILSPELRAGLGLAAPGTMVTQVGPLPVLGGVLMLCLSMALLLATYRAAEVRLSMSARRLGGASVECRFSVWHMVDSYMAVSRKNLWPGLLVWIVVALVAAIPMWGAIGAESEDPAAAGLLDGFGAELTDRLFQGFRTWRAQGLVLMAVVIDYFVSAVFALWLWTCVYQRRRLEHLLESIAIRDAHTLDAVRGRARERGLDAEGFADALEMAAP